MVDSSHSELSTFRGLICRPDWQQKKDVPLLGGRQAGKAPGFGPGIRRFESFPPSHLSSLYGEHVINDAGSK
jgi:hypothetical protein